MFAQNIIITNLVKLILFLVSRLQKIHYRISSISFRPRIVFAALVTMSELILALE